MKLAIVRQKYTPYGGAERFVARALDALRAQGVDVEIVARSWEGDVAGFKCDPFYLGRTWRDAGFSRCVQRVISSGRYDLVQSHERIPGCHIFRAGDGVHAAWLALRSQRKGWFGKLWFLLSPWHRYTLAAEARMFRHPNLKAVICISQMVRDDIVHHYAVDPDKLFVIYNGLDIEAFHPELATRHRAATREQLGIASDVPIFIFVGSGFERKGVATLIAAAAKMHDRKAHFLIVGKDKQAVHYQNQADNAGLAERIHFLGAQQDVRPFLGAADAFVLPTFYEPLSNAVLEALACGLPAVVTTTCGAADLIRPGENGYVCKAGDVMAIAAHLDSLTRPGAAAAMRATARDSIAHLSADAMATKLLSLYRTLSEA